MSSRVRLLLAAGALAAALLAVSIAAAARAPAAKPKPVKPKTTVVNVSMYEFGFKLSSQTVPRGTVIFKVVNDGKLPHDFAFGQQKIPVIDGGQSATLTARFPKPGRFTFICTVEGHAEAGMIGQLVVT